MADISAIKLPNGTTYNIKDINALPLTGGSVTGPVSFGDSVSIDEATVGDLVVNGSASFTNGAHGVIDKAKAADVTSTLNALVKYEDTEGTFSDSNIYNTSNNLIIGSTSVPGNIQIGAKNDNYGILPNTNNYNQIGSSSLYWYRAYINNYYGLNSHVTNWDAGKNIGTASTSSAAAALGSVYFYNACAAGGTQTKTLLSNGSAASNITVTLPSATGTLALTSQIPNISGKADKATTLAGYGITDAKIASGTITLGSNTITPLTNSSTLNAANLSGAIPSAVTATTQTAGDNSTKIATTAFVSSAISGLPTPMQFIGTVGTNGTTTWANLPAASGHNGYTYKVITAHTAETGKPAADVGDALISNGTEWIVIPAGDETATQSATTGISIAAHGTGTVIGVQSTTTTASKVTVGSSSTDYGVKSAGSASTWTFEEKTIPNVTSAGTASSWTFEEKTIPNVTSAGSASTWAFTSKTVVTGVTFAMDTTDTKKLKITTSTDTVYSKSSGSNGTAPTIGTAIKVQSKSGGSNGTAPTLGTAIKVQSKSGGANSTAPTLGSKVPTVSASDVTVPIKNASASTFVTGTTHTVTDNGHTHTI